MVMDECAGFAKTGGCSSHWPRHSLDEHLSDDSVDEFNSVGALNTIWITLVCMLQHRRRSCHRGFRLSKELLLKT